MNILDKINLCHIWIKTYFHEARRWHRAVQAQDPAVFYGFDELPQTDEYVFGGMVKLLDLRSVYSNDSVRPNLLYLVSSALPYFPVRMAKMAKKAGAKVVVNQNGVAYPGWYGKGWQKQNRPMRELLQMADYTIYQSEFCRKSADKFLGPPNGASEVLHNPVDTDVFCPLQADGEDTGEITLLLAGSHWSLYRPSIALAVLQLVRRQKENVRLRIAGRFCWTRSEAEAEHQVRERARELGVENQVDYTGPYSQQEAVELMRDCSILLHTKYNDPCPRLVVEAMACGLPVVYSATGGIPELVGEEGGIGVAGPLDWEQDHPPDPEALAAGVLKVIASLAAFQHGARARAVASFDTKPWLERHVEIFRALLEPD